MLAMKLLYLQLSCRHGSPPEAKPNEDVLESSIPRSIAIGVVCVKDLYSITSHVLRAMRYVENQYFREE